MKAEITNKLVKTLKPESKVYEVRDTSLKGFLLRVETGGTLTYFLEYQRGKRIKLGRGDVITPYQARELAKETYAKFYQGEDPKEEKRQKAQELSFETFLDTIYSAWAASHIRSHLSTLERLRKSFKGLLNKPLSEFHPFLIEKWRSERIKTGIKASTVNRELSDLKACFTRIVTWGYLKDNPIKEVKLSRKDNLPNVRYLSLEEEQRLRLSLDDREERLRSERDSANQWRRLRNYPLLDDLREVAFADYLKPLVLLSLNTGMRRGEALNLSWADIDFNLSFLTVKGDTAKSGKTRHLPLNSEALTTLKEWKNTVKIASVFVFCGANNKPITSVKTSWSKVLARATIDKFRWHDLRHTFASNLVMAGVDLNTVRELLGHSDYNMTLRYAHLAPKHKADAVEKLIGR